MDFDFDSGADIASLANGYLGFAAGQGGDDVDKRDVRDAIEDAVDDVVKRRMEPRAKQLAPEESGDLKRAIGSTVGNWRGNTYEISLEVDESKAPHVRYLADGTRRHYITPKGKPNKPGWVWDEVGQNASREQVLELPSLYFEYRGRKIAVSTVRHPGIREQDEFLTQAGNEFRRYLKERVRANVMAEMAKEDLGSISDPNFRFSGNL